MSLQKYRADKSKSEDQPDGSKCWYSNWIGGPSLAKIEQCRIENLAGEPRATVYIVDEPDTWFSQPAKLWYLGKVLNAYVTDDGEGNIVARVCYF